MIELRADRDDPLEFSHVALISDSVLLAIEKRTGDLWTLPLTGGASRRIGSVNAAGRRRVLAMVAASGVVSMIDAAGRITEDSAGATNPAIVAHTSYGMPRQLMGFSRLSDGSFLLMESAVSLSRGHWVPTDTVSVTRLFRPDSQVVLARWERGGRVNPLGGVSDFSSMRTRAETVYLTGSAPPRGAALFVNGIGRPRFAAFEGITPPPFATGDVKRLVEELRRRGVPDAEVSRLPKTYPAIAAAVRTRGLWFVSSPTSADRFRLMTACDRRPFRDAISGPDVSAIHLLEAGLVLERDALGDGVLRVEYSRYSDFPGGCEP